MQLILAMFSVDQHSGAVPIFLICVCACFALCVTVFKQWYHLHQAGCRGTESRGVGNVLLRIPTFDWPAPFPQHLHLDHYWSEHLGAQWPVNTDQTEGVVGGRVSNYGWCLSSLSQDSYFSTIMWCYTIYFLIFCTQNSSFSVLFKCSYLYDEIFDKLDMVIILIFIVGL